jgi:hypothetical protein
MTAAVPLATTSLVMEMGHGQFSLNSGADRPDYLPVLTRALDGDGVAQGNGVVVVISPQQNNPAMAVEVEIWAEPPPDDVPAWQEVVQAGLQVYDGGLWLQSPTSAMILVLVPTGRYAARISGRGFTGRNQHGWVKPTDSWRIQLWPVDVLPPPVRVARYVKSSRSRVEPPTSHGDPSTGSAHDLEPDRPVPDDEHPAPFQQMRGIRGGIGTPENPSPQARAWLATGLSGVYDPNLIAQYQQPALEPPAQAAPPADSAEE